MEAATVESGDVFLLCSDGLNREVHDEEIAAIISGNYGTTICDTLFDLALSRGCRDTVTAITVCFDANDEEIET